MGKPGTRHGVSPRSEHIGPEEGTGGIETSEYPEEEKATCDSLSSGERNGKSPKRTGDKNWWRCQFGVVGPESRGTRPCTELQIEWIAEAFWNVAPQWVRAPYAKFIRLSSVFPSSAGTVKVGVNLRGPPRKATYKQATDSELVPWGKGEKY